MATRINTDRTTHTVLPANGKTFTLAEVQAIVGGYIEAIYLSDGTIMFCNEHGKLFQHPPNLLATAVARAQSRISPDDIIAGDVIVGTREELGGGDEEEEDA